MTIEAELTTRMMAALDCGDVESLARKLTTWPEEELKALIWEIGESYRRAVRKMEKQYFRHIAQLPKIDPPDEEKAREERQALDENLRQARRDLAEVYGEIAGVASYCLVHREPEPTERVQ